MVTINAGLLRAHFVKKVSPAAARVLGFRDGGQDISVLANDLKVEGPLGVEIGSGPIHEFDLIMVLSVGALVNPAETEHVISGLAAH